MTFDAAIAQQKDVTLDGWLNEWDVCNPTESKPERRFTLYTVLRDSPRLIAAPDAAFVLSTRGFRKIFYLEQDRGTSGVRQIAASKPPGYAELAARGWHKRHFPITNMESFTVLLVTTSSRRRDLLRKAFENKPGAEFWKFTTVEQMTPERTLFESVWYPCVGDPLSLVKPAPEEIVTQAGGGD
jgi:hypothetical protein